MPYIGFEKVCGGPLNVKNIHSGVPRGSILRPWLFFFFIFINDLLNNIKLFADVVKLRVKPLSKEATQIDLNKLSYRKTFGN